jgi:hypothetical protein
MSLFKKGEQVNYVKDGQNVVARIETVHDNDPPNYYYTIKLNDGREKQTDEKYLQKIIEISELKPLSRYEDLKIRVQNGEELGGADLIYYTKFKDMENRAKKLEEEHKLNFLKINKDEETYWEKRFPIKGGKRKSKKVKKEKQRKTKKRRGGSRKRQIKSRRR